LFAGTVDGRSFSARYIEAVIFANLPIPEPTSACLGVLGMASLWVLLEIRRVLRFRPTNERPPTA
jgi:hypothetical protein